jgi:hypothetical protein
MRYQKCIHRAIIILSLLGSFYSCKKLDKDNPIEFKIKAHIPYNDEPISGVRYTIREYRSKKGLGLSEIEYTDFHLEGITNANGIAEIAFFPKKNLDFMYQIDFDYSNIQFASFSGSYSLINAPSYDLITRNNQENYEIRALPHCNVHFKVENINCFDGNDKIRFKTFNSDEFPFKTFETIYVWGDYFNGCGTLFDGTFDDVLSGRKLYQIEVTRNNVVTTYIDTFFLQPGVMNEVFLEY